MNFKPLKLIGQSLPHKLKLDRETYQKRFIFILFSTLLSLYLSAHTFVCFRGGEMMCAYISAAMVFFSAMSVAILYFTKHFTFPANLFVFTNFIGFWLIAHLTGGVNSPNTYWLIIPVVYSFLFLNIRFGYGWAFIFVLGIAALHYTHNFHFLNETGTSFLNDFLYYNFSFVGLAVYMILIVSFKEQNTSQLVSSFTSTNAMVSEMRNENDFLKGEIKVVSKRNYRLVRLYQNLEKLEEQSELKTEILEEATKVLDQKNREIRKTRDQLLAQSKEMKVIHEDLTNSIRYARTIQEAIIPYSQSVTKHFKDAFIFYKPKDIVSGDFYWFAENAGPEKNLKIIIAADCTGHGVPGAFMTVMGTSIINEIIHSRNITSPDKILIELDKKIIDTLNNEHRENKIHDGMDMAVLTINEESHEVQFAAAHNPLYYVRKEDLIQIKGSKFPVGSLQYTTTKEFTLHQIKAEPGDVFYIFTDGFQDQFGEKEQKKYMTRKFRQLLHSINRLPMAKQQKLLESEFSKWKGNTPQTDDVLIIGIRL